MTKPKDTPVYVRQQDRSRLVILSELLGKDRKDTFSILIDSYLAHNPQLSTEASQTLKNSPIREDK